jgi:hypothetical protein
VNLDIPRLEAHFVEEDDPHVNPLGVKGVAEIALVGMVLRNLGPGPEGGFVHSAWSRSGARVGSGRSALSRKY